ncbi:MAG: dependent ligase-like proteinATP dependent ligase family protein [Eubacterium sp.]|nr:dependent ligase-like proteinATP dependent ligase family protein [Eubacterium sp.]
MNWIPPMEPVSSPGVKQGSDFIHEIKWDGIRGMIYLGSNGLKMYTKKGNERTDFYPELDIIEAALRGRNIVLDGEIIVMDSSGKPSFHNVLVRETVKSKRNLQYYLKNYPTKYMLFDILFNEGRLLTGTPLKDRKQILEQTVAPILKNSDTVFLSKTFVDGNELYESMKQKDMEGIVSKKLNSIYLPGKKHEEWFKTKFTKKMLCIIGGIQWKGALPNSLIMGIKNHESSKLLYMGKASLGLKGSDLQLLKQYKNELIQTECPFELNSIDDMDSTGTGLTWVRPAITCWISFLELSNDGHFRHPKILGFSNLPLEEADGKVLTD